MRLGAALLLALCLAPPALADATPPACVGAIRAAQYTIPTDRYPHGALGDPWEWAALSVSFRLVPPCLTGEVGAVVTLPGDMVFEDVRPLLRDLDGDGEAEILTVESQRDRGARLAIYKRVDSMLRRVATTPHIGQRNRWLAQLGAADLDGDGAVEIAYIDRPHLAKTLRIWRFKDGALTPVAKAPGLTNHRFGEPEISGGIRDCGSRPEIVTVDANWFRLIASTLTGGTITRRDIGPYTGPDSMAEALACR